MKKAAFEVHTDTTGAKFVSKGCITKNQREDDEAEERGVMYATEGMVSCRFF